MLKYCVLTAFLSAISLEATSQQQSCDQREAQLRQSLETYKTLSQKNLNTAKKNMETIQTYKGTVEKYKNTVGIYKDKL